MNRITRRDIDEALGFSVGKEYLSMKGIDQYDLSYSNLDENEERVEILNQLKRIKKDTQVVGTPERTEVWENGWKENLIRFKETHSIEALAPMYFRPNCPSRLNGHFIHPNNQLFDYNIEKIIKGCILEEFARDCSDIYEFGCGTCTDVYDLSRLFPDKRLHCRDLTKSSVEIAEILKNEYGLNIFDAFRFDFTKPDKEMLLGENSAVYTFSALEQIGNNYTDFVDYLIEKKPSIIIHLEPMNEVYDDNNLVDWLAKEFHEKRGYLNNFSEYMRSLERQERIEIVYFRRTRVGGWNHESNTILVWKPV